MCFLTLANLTATVKSILMTATEWDSNTMEPNGWIMTERYDGVRIYWNGNNMISRQGRTINAPDFITSQLPKDITLDCELW